MKEKMNQGKLYDLLSYPILFLIYFFLYLFIYLFSIKIN